MDDSDANSTENKKTSQNINDSNDDVDYWVDLDDFYVINTDT
jgi:hypothetical protein